MTPKTVEKLVWALIYGGLLCASLGAFVQRAGGGFGWALLTLGALGVVAGTVLIFVRSRM